METMSEEMSPKHAASSMSKPKLQRALGNRLLTCFYHLKSIEIIEEIHEKSLKPTLFPKVFVSDCRSQAP